MWLNVGASKKSYKMSCAQLFLVMFNSNAVGVLFRSLASLSFEHIEALGDASARGGAASTLLSECGAGSRPGSRPGSAQASNREMSSQRLSDAEPLRSRAAGVSSFASVLAAFRAGESSASPLCPHLSLMSLFSALFQQTFSSEDVLQYDLIRSDLGASMMIYNLLLRVHVRFVLYVLVLCLISTVFELEMVK